MVLLVFNINPSQQIITYTHIISPFSAWGRGQLSVLNFENEEIRGKLSAWRDINSSSGFEIQS